MSREAYRYTDEKSDKFWRIEYAGDILVVNYGKVGTIGKYAPKSFWGDEAACAQEAQKLITSKLRKGYVAYIDFDYDNHYYFDDMFNEEMDNPHHPLTSHPAYRTHFSDELYYDPTNEFGPFGSDEGADLIGLIEEAIRKQKEKFSFVNYPKQLIQDRWEMSYYPALDLSSEEVKALFEEDEHGLLQSDMITYATAFAQIKITGKIGTELKKLALNAMKRFAMVVESHGADLDHVKEIQDKMIADLEQFPSTN